MGESIEFVEEYANKPHRTVFTYNETGIPGLALIGRHHSYIARDPVVCHFHRNCIEMTFMVQGNLVFLANEKHYSINGGDVFITPADMPHDTGSHPMGICEMYWVQLRLDDPSFLFLGKDWASNLRKSLQNLEIGIIRGVGFSRKYLSEMFSLITCGSANDTYQGISRLVHILHGIIGSVSKPPDSPSEDIQRAVDFIHANSHESINLQALADVAGLSLPRFKQKFHQQTGMSPRLFINTQKVEHARELLTQGKTITEVAFDLGFNSSSYFSSVFYKFTRLSPSEFIRKHAGDT